MNPATASPLPLIPAAMIMIPMAIKLSVVLEPLQSNIEHGDFKSKW